MKKHMSSAILDINTIDQDKIVIDLTSANAPPVASLASDAKGNDDPTNMSLSDNHEHQSSSKAEKELQDILRKLNANLNAQQPSSKDLDVELLTEDVQEQQAILDSLKIDIRDT